MKSSLKTLNMKLTFIMVSLVCTFFSSAVFASCRSNQNIPLSTPNNQLQDNGNGTVTDLKTGLMWSKCSVGQSGNNCTGTAATYNWLTALNTASSASIGSYSDWRLPNVKELRSIVEEQCYQPSINLAAFPATPSSSFWTSSPNYSFASFSFYVSFDTGITGNTFRTSARHMRLVRAGF